MSGPADPSVAQMLAEARAQFAASLPAKAAALEQMLSRGAWEEARRAAHKLRGSAGTYGFPVLGAAAGEVEDALLVAGATPDAGTVALVGERARAACIEADRIAKEGA